MNWYITSISSFFIYSWLSGKYKGERKILQASLCKKHQVPSIKRIKTDLFWNQITEPLKIHLYKIRLLSEIYKGESIPNWWTAANRDSTKLAVKKKQAFRKIQPTHKLKTNHSHPKVN